MNMVGFGHETNDEEDINGVEGDNQVGVVWDDDVAPP
jgi:hypothetical protein